MKKLACVALTISVILGSTIPFAIAATTENTYDQENGGKPNSLFMKKDKEKEKEKQGKSEKAEKQGKEEKLELPADVIASIDVLKVELKNKELSKEEKKAIIKEIQKLRKQNKDTTNAIFINSEEVESDVAPVIKEGRTLVPVRAITNGLGATVDWNEETKTVTVSKTLDDGTLTTIIITLGSKVVLVNGQEVTLDVPASTISNRTMVPLRFIAEVFKNNVEYDEESGAVIIEDEVSDDTTTVATADTLTVTVTVTDTTTDEAAPEV